MLIKQFLCAIVLLAFSCQLFNRALIVTSYYTNTEAYAKNCENKAKPMLHCNGKCQMLKKIKAEEKKDENSPERRADGKTQVVLSTKSYYPSIRTFIPQKAILSAPANAGSVTRMPRSVFHPPTV